MSTVVIGMQYGGTAYLPSMPSDDVRSVPLLRCTEHGITPALTAALSDVTVDDHVQFIYRAPWDCVEEAMHAADPHVLADPDFMRTAWLAYHRAVINYISTHPEADLVAYEAKVTSAEQGAMPAIGVRGDGHPIAALYRDIYPDHVQVLLDLDAVASRARPGAAVSAERPAPAGAAPAGAAPARPTHILPGGSLPAGRGVQVIVPCRNDGAFIVEAIASIITATTRKTELTIVDDGSTDTETLRIMRLLQDLGYQVVRTEAVGLAAARNAAVATSQTAAVIPLDCDNRVRCLLFDHVGLVEADEADVVFGDEQYFGQMTHVYSPDIPTLDSQLPDNALDPCALLSRKLLVETGGWDRQFTIWEDWDFWISALTRNARFVKVPGIAFDYCRRPGSILTTSGRDEETRAEGLRALFAKHWDVFADRIVEGYIALDARERRRQVELRFAQVEVDLLRRQRRQDV